MFAFIIEHRHKIIIIFMYSTLLISIILFNSNFNFLQASNSPPNSRIIFTSSSSDSSSSSAKFLFSPNQDEICPSSSSCPSHKEKEFLDRQSYLRNLRLDQPIHVIWAAELKEKEKQKEREKTKE